MAKKITGYIKLQVPAGSANPSPPIGPALGQRGLNIMEFCKAFNAKTQDLEKGMPIPVVITVSRDSFTFVTKTPPHPISSRRRPSIEKGSKTPGNASGRQHHDGAGARDRREQDEGPQRQRYRGRDAHDRGLGPFDGHRVVEGVTWPWQTYDEELRRPSVDPQQVLYAGRSGEAGEGQRHRASSTKPSKSR